jgi:uncharacterized membrane protein
MKKISFALLAIVLLFFVVSIYFYPLLPEKMASHWGASGEVNGYTNKFMGAFFLPVLAAALFLLFIMIPKIDPKKKNIEKFRGAYDSFIAVILLFFLVIHVQTLLWNIGLEISIITTMSIGLGILFFFAGVLIEKAKMNWFIGIRTPWTLSSERVWNKTHKIGGKLFKIAGVIALSGVVFPEFAIYLIIIPVIFAAACSMIYSYFEYQKEKRR